MGVLRIDSEQTRVCELLGIDPATTRRVVIDIPAGRPPVVHVERVGDDRAVDVAALLASAEPEPRVVPAAEMAFDHAKLELRRDGRTYLVEMVGQEDTPLMGVLDLDHLGTRLTPDPGGWARYRPGRVLGHVLLKGVVTSHRAIDVDEATVSTAADTAEGISKEAQPA